MGRVRIDDNLNVTNPVFWSYNKESQDPEEVIKDKFLLNFKGFCAQSPLLKSLMETNLPANFDYLISSFTDNCIYISKSDVLNIINDLFPSDAKRAKMILEVIVDYTGVTLHFIPIKKSTSVFECTAKTDFVNFGNGHCSRIVPNSGFSIYLTYFYNILLDGFDEYDFVKLKFRNDINRPIILQGKNEARNKTETHWAIAQIMLQ